MKFPSRLRIRSKWVEITYQEGFVCGKHDGMYDPNTNVITIAAELEGHKKLECFIHEVIHAISELYELKITEKQVEGMDGPLTRVLEEVLKRNM